MAKDDIKEHEFKKGQSGNPNGRPKGSRNLTTILREMLEEEIEVNVDGVKTKKQFQEVIVRKLLQKANEGNLKAIEQILDRMEGKPVQKQEIKTDNPILTIQREIIDSKPGNTTDVHPAAD